MFKKRKKEEPNRIRTLSEDLLKGVAHRGELDQTWTAEGLVRRDESLMDQALALELLESEGYAERSGTGWRLTSKGHDRALELLRAHRLVETYLARQEGLPASEIHAAAEKAEHEFTTERINKLADSMNRPRFDPHGDPIPERAQDLHKLNQISLLDAEEGSVGRVVHIEDEPRIEFEKLLEMGLALELPVRVVANTGKSISIELAGETLKLPSRLAAHIEIVKVSEEGWYPEDLHRLSLLKSGQKGVVAFISPACMGPERRRLLDFGLVPGSEVQREFSSPFGSPVAYSLRGTTIGLRKAQARNIFIKRES
jgi:DtxR family Mn-dependent transcriptional regulator